MNFTPKQISKFKNDNHVTYQAYFAPAHLSADIYYFWNLKSTEAVSHFNYQIIPDTCIDIILEEKDGKLCNPIISKPFSEPTKVALADKFNYWGIRFKPGKIMKYLWFELSSIKDDFLDIDLHVDVFASLESFLHELYAFKPDQFASKFLRFDYDPTRILESTLSARQKARLFESLTGFRINTYAKIQKFHASLDDPYLHFYDQSHYIKTFKSLTAQTPKNFYRDFSI